MTPLPDPSSFRPLGWQSSNTDGLEAALTAINMLICNQALHRQIAPYDSDPESKGIGCGQNGIGGLAFLYRGSDFLAIQVNVVGYGNQNFLYALIQAYGHLYHTLNMSNHHIEFLIGQQWVVHILSRNHYIAR